MHPRLQLRHGRPKGYQVSLQEGMYQRDAAVQKNLSSQELSFPTSFLHCGDERSRIPSTCSRSSLPMVISGRHGVVPVHVPLLS